MKLSGKPDYVAPPTPVANGTVLGDAQTPEAAGVLTFIKDINEKIDETIEVVSMFTVKEGTLVKGKDFDKDSPVTIGEGAEIVKLKF